MGGDIPNAELSQWGSANYTKFGGLAFMIISFPKHVLIFRYIAP